MANALKTSTLVSKNETLHQLLHGYSEGHRLLESSFKLPDDLVRLVLRMSDLSGNSMVNGFEDYITGYPLPSINSYALAKTWIAPEMPRPGCVWTHTIVIPAPTLTKIQRLSSLLSLFKRPIDTTYPGQYSKDLLFDDALKTEVSQFAQNKMGVHFELSNLLVSYYEKDSGPIILATDDSHEFEDILFMIWSQQWPCQRLSFTFCTGALSSRNIEGRALDIQFVPKKSAKEVMREIAGSSSTQPVLIMPGPMIDEKLYAAISRAERTWMSSAIGDAENEFGGSLRDFLWEVADNTTSRADYGPLIMVYNELSRLTTINSLIAFVSKLFPKPNTGSCLKHALFGGKPSKALPLTYGEPKVLFALSTTEDYQAFDADSLQIHERGIRLTKDKPNSAQWLLGELFRSTLNPMGEEILAGLISAIEPEQANQIITNQSHLLPAFFRSKPSLAASPQLWLSAKDHKLELFESIVARENLDSKMVANIVNALIESESDIFLQRAFERWGKYAVFKALDWTEAHNGKMSITCRMALTFYEQLVMQWVEAKPVRSNEALVAVAHIVAPYSNKLSQHDTNIWLHALNHLKTGSNETEIAYLSTFLLALAFGNAPPAPLDLISETFEYVHKSAGKRRFTEDAWIIMEPIVPPLHWYSNWDKCERLRRGLIKAFIVNKWPVAELKLRIKDQGLLLALLNSAQYVEGGEIFLAHYN